ncbi:uracil-DNA glycosylase [filamentous cyanobacterium LEGE 11480]|uniref:Uracil-DNA glycosylase n=1 Tax=Romeriopsis navalis LEGE 11480 TaxID=2777977 RepID=A0A928VPC3_9CYAN|nr:uracil-DNA glycosylase [Romeriopsis navalis]MBE9032226.1 uracil-DNA glycosylase [Romeriopsis navalis LEGE 11480]
MTTENTASPSSTIQLEATWKAVLLEVFATSNMQALKKFLTAEKADGKIIYPSGPLMFNAMNSTPFNQVKVVILGQDPYHGPGQAHGLSFSVPVGIAPPPSLVNIFKEIEQDLGIPRPNHGCLQSWADQGVLLLNSVLSVEQHKAASHQGKGWEEFTDEIISKLNQQRENLVFLLWGSYAQKKGKFIDRQRHLVLTSPHPSPLAAHRGFFGNKHFSKTNAYLQQNGIEPISWALKPLP